MEFKGIFKELKMEDYSIVNNIKMIPTHYYETTRKKLSLK
jgi:hypothetical protein